MTVNSNENYVHHTKSEPINQTLKENEKMGIELLPNLTECLLLNLWLKILFFFFLAKSYVATPD
ncbi:hypothetical protein HanRHA438_Chr12g0558051 [Helianthus annuus]|uniref:Uncharacterized protein n=1 Tax=Helianthus annuus TaxID=4232 RepID=A0A9K3HHC9_HELAN|nr:hypothetical protein HanXRQr2_Chr12g0546701 [Helianthus annuus]KAJ0866997.1 hypothetical protein HanRHA438_Chr12g0558051 [Helianthus annuus]